MGFSKNPEPLVSGTAEEQILRLHPLTFDGGIGLWSGSGWRWNRGEGYN
jgi:hypothetical protein